RIGVNGDRFVVEDLGRLVVGAMFVVEVAHRHLALGEHGARVVEALAGGGGIGLPGVEDQVVLEVGEGELGGGLIVGRALGDGGLRLGETEIGVGGEEAFRIVVDHPVEGIDGGVTVSGVGVAGGSVHQRDGRVFAVGR